MKSDEPFNFEDDNPTQSFLPARVETQDTLQLVLMFWFLTNVAWAIAMCVVVAFFVTN